MKYEQIWSELEEASGPGAGELLRRIHPESAVDLFLAVGKPLNQRMMMLSVAPAAVEELPTLPSGKGIESRIRPIPESNRVAMELRLTDSSCSDIFGALSLDISEAVAPAADDTHAVSSFLARLRRWQRLLEHLSPDGLSGERQRGLYAELWLLRELLIPAVGPDAGVQAWTGPDAASHDFELSTAAVEVKATAGKQHQILRISSERQLDDTGVPSLYLFHLSLDVRQGDGQTLPEAVTTTKDMLRGTAAATLFEDRLLAVGYVAAHEDNYSRTNYTTREYNFFHVAEDFPRITEADLVPGLGDVRYSVTVAECKHWLVPTNDVVATLIGGD